MAASNAEKPKLYRPAFPGVVYKATQPYIFFSSSREICHAGRCEISDRRASASDSFASPVLPRSLQLRKCRFDDLKETTCRFFHWHILLQLLSSHTLNAIDSVSLDLPDISENLVEFVQDNYNFVHYPYNKERSRLPKKNTIIDITGASSRCGRRQSQERGRRLHLPGKRGRRRADLEKERRGGFVLGRARGEECLRRDGAEAQRGWKLGRGA